MKHSGRSPFMRMVQSGWGRIVLAGAVTAVLLTAFSAVQTVSYLTNDDNAIAYTLAGYHTGEPAPYALFINALLGYFIAALYRAAPAVPWWAVWQLVAVAGCATVIGACMLHIGARRGVPGLVTLGGFAALTVLLFMQPVVELTYTVTAAIIGAAGCALVLCAADVQSRRLQTLLDTLGGLCLVGAFLYREETGFALLCFFFAACGYRALSAVRAALCARGRQDGGPVPGEQANRFETAAWKRDAARAGTLFAVTLTLCLAAFAINNTLQTAYHGAEYREFFRWRERFTDYPRDSFAENPALYESVGWDEAVYDLADDWCFMDARINAASLRTIAEQSGTRRITLARAVRDCLTVIESALPLSMLASLLLCTGVLALFALVRDKRCWPEAVSILCTLLGGAAMCLMLALGGRFLARTFRVIAIPACVLTALLALRMYDARARRADRAGFAAFAAAAALLALVAGVFQAKSLRLNGPKLLLRDSRAVTAYALSHPENAYIRDAYVIADVDATATYPADKPVNLISWGGCEMHSETARRQLAANGLTTPYADVFRRPDVLFLTRTGSAEHTAMARYLEQTYGAVLEHADDVTDELAVYRARFLNP